MRAFASSTERQLRRRSQTLPSYSYSKRCTWYLGEFDAMTFNVFREEGQWLWRLVDEEGPVARSERRYPTEGEVLSAIHKLREEIPHAPTVYLPGLKEPPVAA